MAEVPNRDAEAKRLLGVVCEVLDRLVEKAEPWDGFIPSTIDIATGEMITKLPPAITGQRDGDRALAGSNLVHDQVLLLTLDVLGKELDKPEYCETVDRYLKQFAAKCTKTKSGLFVWGEHAFWDLEKDAPSNSYDLKNDGWDRPLTHDHLRSCPRWLWDRLAAIDASCVSAFADGLQFHFNAGEPYKRKYIRHAHIEQRVPHPDRDNSCDFPRHGGFYIYDMAYAYSLDKSPAHIERIREFVEYWWPMRRETGLLLLESDSPRDDRRNMTGVAQTLSLATSLLEAAPLIEDDEPELAATMRGRAMVYIDGFFAAPHRPEDDEFLIAWMDQPPHEEKVSPVWGSRYGQTPVSYTGMNVLLAYRLTGDERLLDMAKAMGQTLLHQPFTAPQPVPAMDPGLGLNMLGELYAMTGESHWLEDAMTTIKTLERVYFENGLVRGASDIEWYESQMGPGFLLHGIARIAMLAQQGSECPLAADFTAR